MVSRISGPPPETTQDRTQIKDTHPVPGYKLKFLTPPGIKPGPPSSKAGILPTTPRRRTFNICARCCLLFNDGHVLQLRAEIVAVHRGMIMIWMIFDGHMKPRDECGLNFQTYVLQLRKNVNQDIDPTGDRTRACSMRSNDVTLRPQRYKYLTPSGIEPGTPGWKAEILPTTQ